MKKFQNHDKYSEGYSRSQQKLKLRTEETRKFSKHDRESCFADENMPIDRHKHSYQTERRSKSASRENPPVNQDFQDRNFKKTSRSNHSTNEYLSLNEIKSDGEQHSGTKENYRKFYNTSPSYSSKGNGYSHPKNPPYSDKFNSVDTRMKFKREVLPVNNAKDECLNIKIRNDKFGVSEKSPSTNLNVKNSRHKSSSPFPQDGDMSSKPDKSFLHYNKQNDTINAYSHDVSKSVYSHEEKAKSESYVGRKIPNKSQKSALLNDSTSYEAMGFSLFKLTDLLYYNVSLMQDQQLFEYALAVKDKVLEKIDKFQNVVKEELEFLCEITDGDQSEKNQRFITSRMCRIVQNFLESHPFLLDALSTPTASPANESMPNLNGLPVLETIQDSDALFTSATDCNILHDDDNIPENHKCVILKDMSDFFDTRARNDHREDGKVQNFNTTDAKNNHQVHSSFNAIEDKNIAKESSEYRSSSASHLEGCRPVKRFSFDKNKSTFIVFGLDNLLMYDINAMQGNLLFDYAFSLKKKILDKIYQFENPYAEKLRFLCDLTDGTQMEQNQKLIIERMCELINSANDKGCVHTNSENFSGQHSRNVDSRKSYSDAKRR